MKIIDNNIEDLNIPDDVETLVISSGVHIGTLTVHSLQSLIISSQVFPAEDGKLCLPKK